MKIHQDILEIGLYFKSENWHPYRQQLLVILQMETITLTKTIVQQHQDQMPVFSLLLDSLFCGLGDLSSRKVLGGDALDDADSDSLSHITNSEPSQRGEVGEGLNAHGLAGDQVDDGSISRLDELGLICKGE